MSGLEPIAALSLACNILQVIGIGLETVRVPKQVYRDGALDPALADKAAVLDDLGGQIRATTSRKRASPQGSHPGRQAAVRPGREVHGRRAGPARKGQLPKRPADQGAALGHAQSHGQDDLAEAAAGKSGPQAQGGREPLADGAFDEDLVCWAVQPARDIRDN